MKLLITALSSILAVCSVTVANPVLTSSITSIESTSTTASPSTTAASEPDYSNPFDPYSLYMTNCYPINFDGILLIEMLASTTHRAEQIEKSINKKKAETKNQKKVAGPSGYGLGILNLESMLAEEVKILKKHREDLNELLLEYSNINEEVTKSRSELGEHFKKNYKTKAMNANGEIDLDLIPEFLSCFDSFYYRLPQ